MRPGFWFSSIGKKFLVAATGFILFGFVVAHMLGNLQIFLGREALNSYAEHLEELPALLWPARGVLLVSILIHIVLAVQLSIQNRQARPVAYTNKKSAVSTFASRTMLVTGSAVFFFIVYHLLHFTFKAVHPQYSRFLDAHGNRDVYSMVVASFRDPWIAASYVLAMIFLCLHLSHGARSLFQSLGASDEELKPFWKWVARGAAAVIFIGNCSIVTASYFGLLPLPGKNG